MRASGVLLPISSLPSAYGIGSFSKEAYEFVDQLKAGGQKYWQILPLGPTGYARLTISVFFYLCRKSLLYRSGNTDRGWSFDKRGM